MTPSEAISQLLVSTAENVEAVEAVVQLNEGHWTMQLAGEIALDLTLTDQGQLLITAPLGTPPAEQAAQIHAHLLTVNLVSLGRAGMVMAAQGAEGPVSLLLPLTVADLSEQSFAQHIGRLMTAVPVWTRFVATGSLAAEAPAEFDPAAMIRV